jgi:hypothetical protein
LKNGLFLQKKIAPPTEGGALLNLIDIYYKKLRAIADYHDESETPGAIQHPPGGLNRLPTVPISFVQPVLSGHLEHNPGGFFQNVRVGAL